VFIDAEKVGELPKVVLATVCIGQRNRQAGTNRLATYIILGQLVILFDRDIDNWATGGRFLFKLIRIVILLFFPTFLQNALQFLLL